MTTFPSPPTLFQLLPQHPRGKSMSNLARPLHGRWWNALLGARGTTHCVVESLLREACVCQCLRFLFLSLHILFLCLIFISTSHFVFLLFCACVFKGVLLWKPDSFNHCHANEHTNSEKNTTTLLRWRLRWDESSLTPNWLYKKKSGISQALVNLREL